MACFGPLNKFMAVAKSDFVAQADSYSKAKTVFSTQLLSNAGARFPLLLLLKWDPLPFTALAPTGLHPSPPLLNIEGGGSQVTYW